MKKNTFAFTLLELIVVITIIGIISMATYLPYAHHQKKVLVKQAAREITQSLSDARNLAINGLSEAWGSNLNVAIYFDTWAQSVEYHTSTGALNISNISSATLLRTKRLPAWAQVDLIAGNSNPQMFWFSAITWSWFTDPDLGLNPIDIQLSFKGANSPILQKNIRYYPQSYISDY